MDKNKVSREELRRLLLDANDDLQVNFPAPPCPYPAVPVANVSPACSVDGDKRKLSAPDAKIQCAMNHAAYQDNLRRGAGNTVLYGTEGKPSEDRDGAGGGGGDY